MAAPEILFITRKWAPAVGGMETWAHRLSDELARLAPVKVIALPGRSDGRPPSAAALLGFPFTVLRRILARKTAPDVVHIGDMALWPLGVLARWRFSAARVVLTAHGTDVSYPRRGGLKGRAYGAYLRLGARLLRQALVTANSPATERITRGYGWKNILVIPLATDLVASPEVTAPGRHLLFAGRLVERKGCAWFIRQVLPLLPPEIELHVAGPLTDPQEAAALGNPRVRYLGTLGGEALARAYREALAVVVPNIEPANGEFEGFGLVACEAAAAGGVVLAADCGGLPAAVIDKVTGMLVQSGNPQAWAERIADLAQWPAGHRAGFVTGSLAAIADHYRWPRVAEATLTAYLTDPKDFRIH